MNWEPDLDKGLQEIHPDCHHVCLIYDSEEQRRKTVTEFLARGLTGR